MQVGIGRITVAAAGVAVVVGLAVATPAAAAAPSAVSAAHPCGASQDPADPTLWWYNNCAPQLGSFIKYISLFDGSTQYDCVPARTERSYNARSLSRTNLTC